MSFDDAVTMRDLVRAFDHALLAGDDLLTLLAPHQTTVLDVVLPRKIHEGVFRLTGNPDPQDFRQPVLGTVIS